MCLSHLVIKVMINHLNMVTGDKLVRHRTSRMLKCLLILFLANIPCILDAISFLWSFQVTVLFISLPAYILAFSFRPMWALSSTQRYQMFHILFFSKKYTTETLICWHSFIYPVSVTSHICEHRWHILNSARLGSVWDSSNKVKYSILLTYKRTARITLGVKIRW